MIPARNHYRHATKAGTRAVHIALAARALLPRGRREKELGIICLVRTTRKITPAPGGWIVLAASSGLCVFCQHDDIPTLQHRSGSFRGFESNDPYKGSPPDATSRLQRLPNKRALRASVAVSRAIGAEFVPLASGSGRSRQ